MAVTMQQVLAEIDREEPDYPTLARFGADALPHLKLIAGADDPLKASKAAYAATLIGGAGATELLRTAAEHHDPQVRIAVAHGLQNMGSAAPSDLVLKGLGDVDAGVRKRALGTAGMLRRADFGQQVNAMVQHDPAEHLRSAAAVTQKQLMVAP
ncbi:HEAT repeat domain-containing protein [Sphaerotilus sp.]|jgi:HEAT repeats|uniref:HEAT repeat domain-containing protein n=1 Tax=Sphaerotilus sp. TaxID=2093942 RepID=UPI0025F81E25|nr:HEAT repeat domain-containing protein [Sphaerotilus sp.]